jgi:hypothetical protein
MEHSEIRALLEKITPGEWEYSELTGCVWKKGTMEDIASYISIPNGKFVAASPTIIRQLLDELERLTAENERLDRLYKLTLSGGTTKVHGDA